MNFLPLLIDALKIPILLFALITIGRFFYGEFTQKLKHSFVRNNIELVLGSIILFSVFAIIKTHGKTVLSLSLIILILQYFLFKIRPRFSNLKFKKEDFFNLLSLFVVFLVFFGIQLYKSNYFNSEYINIGWCDYNFYSDVAERMLISGHEKTMEWHHIFNTNNFSFDTNPIPYHFYELWIDAFLLVISKSAGMYVFQFIFFPFIETLVFASLFSLVISFYKEINTKKWLFLFFIVLVFVFFVGKLPYKAGGWESNVFNHPRLFTFYIFFPIFIMFIKLNRKYIAFVFLSLLIYFNILYLPTILGVIGIFSLFYFFVVKNRKLAIFNLGLATASLLLIFVFYFVLFKSKSAASLNTDEVFPLSLYFVQIIKDLIRLNFMRVWFFYIPLAIFVGYFILRKIKERNFSFLKNELIIASVLVYFFSAFFAVAIPHFENGTIGSIVANPLLTIISLSAFIYLLKSKKNIFIYGLIALLIFQASYSVIFNIDKNTYKGTTYSKKFLKQIEQNFKPDNKIGVMIQDTTNRKTSFFANHPTTCKYTSIFDIVDNGYVVSSISTQLDENECIFEEMRAYIIKAPFYKFGNYKIKNKNITDIEEIQKLFITEYGIEYILLFPNTSIPSSIKPLVDNEFYDNISKVRVVTLKY